MNDITTCRLIAGNAQQTQALGRLMGSLLKRGMVIRLLGDLGAGKTCFVQGLAKGLDVPQEYPVTSPTYTLINEFPGRLPLFHVDLYRIHGSEDAEAIGFWDIMSPKHVVAVEWADRIAEPQWPPGSLTLHFHPQPNEDRLIDLIGSGLQTANLIKKIGSLWREQAATSSTPTQ